MPKNLPVWSRVVKSWFQIWTFSLRNSSNDLYLLIVSSSKYASSCNDNPTLIPTFLHISSISIFSFHYFYMYVPPSIILLLTFIPIPIYAITLSPSILLFINIPPNFYFPIYISFIHLNFVSIPYNSFNNSHTLTDVKTVKVERRLRGTWDRIVM